MNNTQNIVILSACLRMQGTPVIWGVVEESLKRQSSKNNK
jgi:hypothetical protein